VTSALGGSRCTSSRFRCSAGREEPSWTKNPTGVVFLHLQIALPPEPTAPRIARHRIAALQPVVPDDVVHDVQMVVSELVTNAVVHAGLGLGDHVELDLHTRPGGVEVMLHYPGHRGFELTLPLVPGGSSGLGLFLVDQIASRWSVIETRGEMEAWFEVDVPTERHEGAARPSST
jgi:anti-sigma regulatory factor (Ser/Thr protein kinase)